MKCEWEFGAQMQNFDSDTVDTEDNNTFVAQQVITDNLKKHFCHILSKKMQDDSECIKHTLCRDRGVNHWRNRRWYLEYGYCIPAYSIFLHISNYISNIFNIPVYSVFRSYSCIFLAKPAPIMLENLPIILLKISLNFLLLFFCAKPIIP